VDSTWAILVISSILILGLIGYSQEALAAVPTIVLFEANDPDNADTLFSVGDTILIRFSEGVNAANGGTMTAGEFAANFTIAGTAAFDGTFTGAWSNPDGGGSRDLTLTWTIIGAATPIVGTTTIDDNAATTNLFDAATTTDKFVEDGTDTLTGDFGIFIALTGSSCSSDCFAPTLGVDNEGNRHVTDGFTYNGNPINVERYFTPYPLITVDVGILNTAQFKIYENNGPDNIRHFELAFGLGTGQIISVSKAVIEWDKTFDGIETVTVKDPDNVLQNVHVQTTTGKCADDSATECLIVTVDHIFRAPLDFNIVGTNVWDARHNSWQNYYNHGIEIQGKSLNPPNEYFGIYKGKLIHLIETAKNTAIDADGNTWTFDNTWIKDFIYKGKIGDPKSSKGYDRDHVKFSAYKQEQGLVASSFIEKYYKTSVSHEQSFAEIYNIVSHEYPDTIPRHLDPELQAKMSEEMTKAEKYLQEMYAKMYPSKVFGESILPKN